MKPLRKSCEILKVDEELGLVFGWAIISTEDGMPYVDRQGDWIPEEAMLKRAAEFAQSSRHCKAMHEGEPRGEFVFTFPLTREIAKALGIETGERYGLIVAAKPDAETLARVRAGELSGFSIGGVSFGHGEEEAA